MFERVGGQRGRETRTGRLRVCGLSGEGRGARPLSRAHSPAGPGPGTGRGILAPSSRGWAGPEIDLARGSDGRRRSNGRLGSLERRRLRWARPRRGRVSPGLNFDYLRSAESDAGHHRRGCGPGPDHIVCSLSDASTESPFGETRLVGGARRSTVCQPSVTLTIVFFSQ